MRRGVAKRFEVNAELDLIPVLSLIIHIVPMLLVCVRFLTVAQIEASGPVVPIRDAPDAQTLTEQEERVVSVRIGPRGFTVGGAGWADPDIACLGTCSEGGYDYVGLGRALADAHARLPDERRVVIAPSPDTPYEVMVRVLDVAREDPTSGTPMFPTPLIAAPTEAP